MTTACLFEKNHLEIKLFKGEEERETQRETKREERERREGRENTTTISHWNTTHTLSLLFIN